MAAAEALRDREEIQFVIIGEGSKRPLVVAAVEAGLPNLRLLPYVPATELPYSLACADVGIVTLASGYEDFSVPSKTYNLLAAGMRCWASAKRPTIWRKRYRIPGVELTLHRVIYRVL
ncbi:MAG: hypothetical protein IPF56_21515 [Chloroflexi bacterium]|nr:hypothetical protein [Chloroflexota bacterium]